MRMVELIEKKREGHEHTKEEIIYIVTGYTDGTIPDYQMSAWAMAVYFRGMTARETADLTLAMAGSGDQFDLTTIPGVKVDKHSTGGVGDKTTLVVAPLVAATGIPVAKMSGRGLGHSGGTIDKLESIAGFEVERTREQFIAQVKDVGVAIVGQSGNLTPADKKLYALRDVTATINTKPLIASSIMSKKIASGADAIILDVKVGKGAFMKTLEEAEELAHIMVAIGEQVGRRTVAVLSDMNQPLGNAVGNALEVKEAIDTLAGKGPADLTELSLTIGAHMLVLGKLSDHFEEAYQTCQEMVTNGKALQILANMIEAQGGNPEVVYDTSLLPHANKQIEVKATSSGYISQIDAERIGHASVLLGAGRLTKEMSIDLAVGIVLNKKAGDFVSENETIAIIHSNEPKLEKEVYSEVVESFVITQEKTERSPLIYKII